MDLEDARKKIASWMKDYNHFRTHSSLGDLTPNEVVVAHTNSPEIQS